MGGCAEGATVEGGRFSRAYFNHEPDSEVKHMDPAGGKVLIREHPTKGDDVYHDANCSMPQHYPEGYRVTDASEQDLERIGYRECRRSGACRKRFYN
jgi:hypothetical protein